MAAGLGLEPRYPPPEGGVLPLDDPAMPVNLAENYLTFHAICDSVGLDWRVTPTGEVSMTPKITFRITPHHIRPGVEVVEVLLDGELCATVVPDEKNDCGLKIASAHFVGELTHNNEFPTGVRMDTGETHFPPIPAVLMSFDIRAYTMEPRRIVRQ